MLHLPILASLPAALRAPASVLTHCGRCTDVARRPSGQNHFIVAPSLSQGVPQSTYEAVIGPDAAGRAPTKVPNTGFDLFVRYLYHLDLEPATRPEYHLYAL